MPHKQDDKQDDKLYVPFVWQVYWERLLAKTSHLKPEEFGGYVRLLLHQLRQGEIPADEKARLAQIIGCTPAAARRMWGELGRFFQRGDDGRWRNRRLEEGRNEQARHALNGAKGGHTKHANRTRRAATTDQDLFSAASQPPTPTPTPTPTPLATPSPSQTASQPPTPEPSQPPSQTLASVLRTPISDQSSVPLTRSVPTDAVPVARAVTRAPARSAAGPSNLDWWQKHGAVHLPEFCDWMCFPQELAQQFAGRLPGVPFEEAYGQVLEWARGVRVEFAEQGRAPTGRMFDFWNARWEEAHGSSKARESRLDAMERGMAAAVKVPHV